MEMRIYHFKSFEEAEEFDCDERRRMTPQERLDLVEHLRREGAAFLNHDYDVPFQRTIRVIR